MCEASVYLISRDGEKEIMQDVQFLDVQDDHLSIVDLFGKEQKLQARVKTVNFARHKVILEEC